MNLHTDHRARLRATITTLWLAAAAALLTLSTDGTGRLVALGALVGAVAAGQLLANGKLTAVAGIGASSIALAALWAAGADPLGGVLAAIGVAGSSGIARWASAGAAASPPAGWAPSQHANRQYQPAPAEARLPAGVADERLLDRLAVHEMTRARRYEHPLTLLLVHPDGPADTAGKPGSPREADQLASLAVRLRRLLRDVDAIGLYGDGQLAVLLPETPLDGALVVAGRIEEAARDDVGVCVRVGAAVFPDDAVTVDGLLLEAQAAVELARLEGNRVAQRVELR